MCFACTFLQDFVDLPWRHETAFFLFFFPCKLHHCHQSTERARHIPLPHREGLTADQYLSRIMPAISLPQVLKRQINDKWHRKATPRGAAHPTAQAAATAPSPLAALRCSWFALFKNTNQNKNTPTTLKYFPKDITTFGISCP